MKSFLSSIVVLLVCFNVDSQSLASHNVIPRPSSVVPTNETFALLSTSAVHLEGVRKAELVKIGNYLVDELRPSTGFAIPVKSLGEPLELGSISLSLTDSTNSAIGVEGYVLTITNAAVTIVANEPAGVFYGVQTVLQLFPSSILKKTVQNKSWKIHTGIITDAPTYKHRGTMLDIARHFFGPDVIKREIDRVARYKMNIFHLHLTDDQGWRIEINSRPNLTIIGGSTEVGGGPGGFLTQTEYIDIVKYARDRFVTIIPEIDLPGHTMAALASYGELNCNGIAKPLYTGTQVGISTLCADSNDVIKPEVLTFLNDVLTEIAAITPGNYIHVGGDESHITSPGAYKEFIKVAQEIVNREGKVMLGWADISASDINPSSIAQFWHTNKTTALEAVAKGAKIIMSPAHKIYLDIKYNNNTPIGLTWAGLNNCKDAYSWNPATFATGINKSDIHGVSACLWSETVETQAHIDLLTYPRLPGVAEAGWSKGSLNDWEEYKVRLGFHKNRFENLNIEYYASPLVPWNDDLDQTFPDLYCAVSGGLNGRDRWITSLNTTGAEMNLSYTNNIYPPRGFEHYTSNGLTVNKESVFILNIDATNDTQYTRLKAWIDWNRDGDFEDIDEEIISYGEANQSNANTVLDISERISVPVFALVGDTRMRVRYTDAWRGLPVPCGAVDFSVTHDFNIKIKNTLSVNNLEETNKFSVYPNPTTEEIIFNLEVFQGESIHINFINMNGKIVKGIALPKVEASTLKIPLKGISPGLYHIIVKKNDKQLIIKKLIIE